MGNYITVVSVQIFEIFTKDPMSKSRTDLESQYINETEISSYWASQQASIAMLFPRLCNEGYLPHLRV